MLQHVAPDIIAAVNRFFGYAAIAGVRMTHGQIARAALVHQPAMLKPVTAELGDSLRDIGDPELRNVLERMVAGLATPPKLHRISGWKDNIARWHIPQQHSNAAGWERVGTYVWITLDTV